MNLRKPPATFAFNQPLALHHLSLFNATLHFQKKIEDRLKIDFAEELKPNYIPPVELSEEDYKELQTNLEEVQKFCRTEFSAADSYAFLENQIKRFATYAKEPRVKSLFQFIENGLNRIFYLAQYIHQLQRICDLQANIDRKAVANNPQLNILLRRKLQSEADCLNFYNELTGLYQNRETQEIKNAIGFAQEQLMEQVGRYRYIFFRRLQAEAEERVLVNDLLKIVALSPEDFIILPTHNQHNTKKKCSKDKLGDPDLNPYVHCHENPQQAIIKNKKKVFAELTLEIKSRLIQLFSEGKLNKNNSPQVLKTLVLQTLIKKIKDDLIYEEKKMLLRWYTKTPRSNLIFQHELKQKFEETGHCDWFAGREICRELDMLEHDLEVEVHAKIDYQLKCESMKRMLQTHDKKNEKNNNLRLANQFHQSSDILGEFVQIALTQVAEVSDFIDQPNNQVIAEKIDPDVKQLVLNANNMVSELTSPPEVVDKVTEERRNSTQKNKKEHDIRKNSNEGKTNNNDSITKTVAYTGGFGLLGGGGTAATLFALTTLPIVTIIVLIVAAVILGGVLGLVVDQSSNQCCNRSTPEGSEPSGSYRRINKDLSARKTASSMPGRKYTNAAHIGVRPPDLGFAGTHQGNYDSSLRRRVSQRRSYHDVSSSPKFRV